MKANMAGQVNGLLRLNGFLTLWVLLLSIMPLTAATAQAKTLPGNAETMVLISHMRCPSCRSRLRISSPFLSASPRSPSKPPSPAPCRGWNCNSSPVVSRCLSRNRPPPSQ